MLFHNFGKIIIKSNKINVKRIYSPSDVHCFGGRLEYPSSVTDFFLVLLFKVSFKTTKYKKFDQKKNITRVMNKSLYIAYSFHH